MTYIRGAIFPEKDTFVIMHRHGGYLEKVSSTMFLDGSMGVYWTDNLSKAKGFFTEDDAKQFIKANAKLKYSAGLEKSPIIARVILQPVYQFKEGELD